jgi:hypothetical protein
MLFNCFIDQLRRMWKTKNRSQLILARIDSQALFFHYASMKTHNLRQPLPASVASLGSKS